MSRRTGVAGRAASLSRASLARAPASARQWFRRKVLARRWATFVVLGVSFFVFGAGTVNFFFVIKSNIELLVSYGWQAAMDGGLRQLVELLLTGYASMAAYVVFKACEHVLVEDLTHGDS